ncbi:MAG: chorismate-binding protein, partial [Anaerolineales bacterium]|nr:chorismate-binding protein [Anaerolineales bacterium]
PRGVYTGSIGFCFPCYGAHRDLHSLPTRRSSDLMGRVADVGSVTVPKLFEVGRDPTLLQMTSTVAAQTQAPISQILANMFPCASITGAPKVRTMEIIKELEPQPRGVYTGSIGFWDPDGQAQFNVAIRTVLVDRELGQATYGVGSGIVWDSVAGDEYEECRVKSRVLTEKRPSFQLIETMLWQPDGGVFLLDEHLERLRNSAEYFGIEWAETAVLSEIESLTQTLNACESATAFGARRPFHPANRPTERWCAARSRARRAGKAANRFTNRLAVPQNHPPPPVRGGSRQPPGVRRRDPAQRARRTDRSQQLQHRAAAGWRTGDAAG